MDSLLGDGKDNHELELLLAEHSKLKEIDLNEVLNLDQPSTFIFTMGADNLVEEGIYPGDYIVVRRDVIPEPNMLIVAKVKGKFVIRHFAYQDQAYNFARDNVPNYVEYSPDGRPLFDLFGVVSGVFRKLRRGNDSDAQ